MEKCSNSAERSLVSLNMTCSPSLVSLTMSCGPYLNNNNNNVPITLKIS